MYVNILDTLFLLTLVCLFIGITRVMDGGRKDDAIGEDLDSLAHAIAQNQQNNQNAEENDEFRVWGKYHRNNPATFKGQHDPDGTQAWLRGTDKIFRVMACTEVQKVQFGTHMLGEEAKERWDFAR